MANRLKANIRSLTRQIENKKGFLDAAQIEQKRKSLAECQKLLAQVQAGGSTLPPSEKQVAHEQKQKKAKRQKFYSKIRFFEKTKLTRLLNRARKQLATTVKGSPEEKKLREQVKQFQEQLDYVENYPQDKKYVAIFPAGKASSVAATGTKDEEEDDDDEEEEEGDEVEAGTGQQDGAEGQQNEEEEDEGEE